MEHVIEHSGVVKHVVGDEVFVSVAVLEACASCRARGACGMGESQEKIIRVVTPEAATYAVGDPVRVGVLRSVGGMAVFFAYILALGILLVLLIFGLKVAGWSEGLSALLALSGVGIYYAVLWLYRHKMESKIHFTITKQ